MRKLLPFHHFKLEEIKTNSYIDKHFCFKIFQTWISCPETQSWNTSHFWISCIEMNFSTNIFTLPFMHWYTLLGCPNIPTIQETICFLSLSHYMVNSWHKMTKIFKIGAFLRLPLLMWKIQRIFKIYKGKKFPTRFFVFVFLNNFWVQIGWTGVIAEVQTVV